MEMKIKVIDKDLICPTCGSHELRNPDAPVRDWIFNIKAYKVFNRGKWWSKCCVCADAGRKAHWFDDRGEVSG
jgi:hypothetical protein